MNKFYGVNENNFKRINFYQGLLFFVATKAIVLIAALNPQCTGFAAAATVSF